MPLYRRMESRRGPSQQQEQRRQCRRISSSPSSPLSSIKPSSSSSEAAAAAAVAVITTIPTIRQRIVRYGVAILMMIVLYWNYGSCSTSSTATSRSTITTLTATAGVGFGLGVFHSVDALVLHTIPTTTTTRRRRSSPITTTLLRSATPTTTNTQNYNERNNNNNPSKNGLGTTSTVSTTTTNNNNDNKNVVVYRYFGYGSNVLPSTMKALRGIDVTDDVTAAILPNYELQFYGSNRNSPKGQKQSTKQWVESSSAFVQPVPSSSSSQQPVTTPTAKDVVHGVLYTLSAEDFARVGQTEGVPWAYLWQRCTVYPYVGDAHQAGMDRYVAASSGAVVSTIGDGDDNKTSDDGNILVQPPSFVGVEAYTLVPPPSRSTQGWVPVPPSASYLGLIQQGARLWKFDKDYQDKLASVEVATNLLIKDGISELALRVAEKATGTDRTYRIGR
jgi:hypothetical protein